MSDKNVGSTAPRPVTAVGRSNKNVGRSAATDGNVASEARRLSTLLEVSQALSGTLNLKASLHRVLEILTNHHGAVRGLVSLLQADGDLRVEASDGLADALAAGPLPVGEGITGKVVQSGKPIVVPRVSREPAFLHRAARRPELAHQELSFVCVPIVLNRRAIGALAIDLKFKPERNFDRSTEVPRHRGVDDRPGDQDPSPDRRGQADAGGREHAPAPGAPRTLRLLELGRQQRPDAADLRAGHAGRRAPTRRC